MRRLSDKKTTIILTVAVILITVIAVMFSQPQQSQEQIIALGQSSDEVVTNDITVDSGSDLWNMGLQTSIKTPGTVDSIYQNATAIYDTTGLQNALKTGGTYYLANNIEYNAMTSSSSTAINGIFSGTLYGNGKTVTVKVQDGTSYDGGSTNGTYGFLVKAINGGLIRDLNVVIQSNQVWTKFGIKLGSMTYTSQPEKNRGTYDAYMARIGGIAGNIYGDGVVYNCSVTYKGNLVLVNNGATPGTANAVEWGKNCVYYFGGLAGGIEGGYVAYTDVIYDGNVVHTGQLNEGGSNMMMATGGLVAQVNGSAVIRKVSIQGGGYLATEGHIYSKTTTSTPSSDSYAGGIVGWVTKNGSVDINGIYLNLTQLSSTSEGSPWGGTDNMSQGNSGSVKNYFYNAKGCSGASGFTRWYDSVDNDYAKNISSSENAHMSRSSYGIGAAQVNTSISMSNVYVSSAMDNVIKKHHPYAINYIQNGSDQTSKNNSYWDKYRWNYNVVSTANGILDFEFAPYSAIGQTSSRQEIINNVNEQRIVYLKFNKGAKSNFVYSLTQGGDKYNIYTMTYNYFPTASNIFIPINYTGFYSTNNAQVKDSANYVNQSTDNFSPAKVYETTTEYGSWLNIDIDMTTKYDGADRLNDGYTGAGTQYSYVYNGNYLYIPAFAGYDNGAKVSLSVDEQNSITGGTANFSLTSSSTIVNPSSASYPISGYLFEGAGNVGNYTLTYSKPSNLQNVFITKNGKNYYCNMSESYAPINITVNPFTSVVNWTGTENLKYDGTNKQITAQLSGFAQGNELGNNDSSNITLSVKITALNSELMPNNLPLHAGSYTATATLNYEGSSSNVKIGNYLLESAIKDFVVSARQITIKPNEAQSTYGSNNHSEVLAQAGISVVGGDDFVSVEDKNNFIFAPVFDTTVQINSHVGQYPTTIHTSIKDGASELLLTDYNFTIEQGQFTIIPRKITGTLVLSGGVYDRSSNFGATLNLDDNVRFGSDRVFTISYTLNGETFEKISQAGVYNVQINADTNYELGDIVAGDTLYSQESTTVEIRQREVDITLSFENGYVYDTTHKVTAFALQDAQQDKGILEGDVVNAELLFNGAQQAIMPSEYNTTAQLDNANYKVGQIINGQFVIEKATLGAIEVTSNTATYDGQQKQLGYNLTGVEGEQNLSALIGAVTITYNSSVSNPVDAGEYVVVVTVAEGSGYKQATYTDIVFTVNRADIEITVDGISDGKKQSVYTGKVHKIDYSLSAPAMTNPQDFSQYVSITSDKEQIKNAGIYNIEINFAKTRNYNAKQLSFVYEITKADLDIVFKDKTYVYNRQAQQPEYQIVTALASDVYGAVSTSLQGQNATDGNAINAGSYTFTVSIAESENYNALQKTKAFEIQKYDLGFVADSLQFVTLKENESTVTADYIPSVQFAVVDTTGQYNADSEYFTVKADKENFELVGNRGNFAVTVTFTGDKNNYNFEDQTISVEVIKAQFTITVNGQIIESALYQSTYGESMQIEVNATYNGEVQQLNPEQWYKLNSEGVYEETTQTTDAGEYKIVYSFNLSEQRATGNTVTKTLYLSIAKKQVQVQLDASNMSFVYGDAISTDNAGYSNGENLTLTINYGTNAQQYSEVGVYNLYGTVTAVSGQDIQNYIFEVVNDTFEIQKKTVYIKANNATAEYGQEISYAGFKVYEDENALTEWSGYAQASPLNIRLVTDGAISVGVYPISVEEASANTNYNVLPTAQNGNLEITKRQITLNINEFRVEYGSATLPATYSADITGGSLAYGDILEQITAEVKQGVDIAKLTVNADGYNGDEYLDFKAQITSTAQGENYTIVFTASQAMKITAKKLNVVFEGFSDGEQVVQDSAVYNAKNWYPSVQLEGVVNGDDISVVADQEIKNTNTYTVKLILQGSASGNYTIDNIVKTLQITPYKTVIEGYQADGYIYTYGEEKQAIKATAPIIDGDSSDAVVAVKYYVGENTGITGTQINWQDLWNAGTYTAVLSFADDNYYADNVYLTITVLQKQIEQGEITAIKNQLESRVYNGYDEQKFIEDLVNQDEVYELIKNYLKVVYLLDGQEVDYIKNAGEYSINIVLEQNTNYVSTSEYLLAQPIVYVVEKASADELTFSLSNHNKEYDASDMTESIKQSVVILGINSETVSDGDIQIVVRNEQGEITEQIVNAGTYSLTISVSGLANYQDVTERVIEDTFTVEKVVVFADTIKFESKTFTYDGSEHSLQCANIPESAVLLGVEYEYGGQKVGGIVNATAEQGVVVVANIYFDSLNADMGNAQVQETSYNEKSAYKYTLEATIVVNKAIPTISTVANSRSYYFDGEAHDIDFTIKGVKSDIDTKGYVFEQTDGKLQYTLDGLGSISIAYYSDKDYTTPLVNEQGEFILPSQVLKDESGYKAYYMQITFTSQDENYADTVLRDKNKEMTLVILPSAITLDFNELTVNYGTLLSRNEANEYIAQNLTYDYYIDEVADASQYDIKSIIDIIYNVDVDINLNVGKIKIGVVAMPKAENANSCSVVVLNADKIYLEILPINVTSEMKQVFSDVKDVYGNKVYNASNIGWQDVIGVYGEKVDYIIQYQGAVDFELKNAGRYELTVRIPQGNYNEWEATYSLDIAQVGVDIIYMLSGEQSADNTFSVVFNGSTIELTATVAGDYTVATCEYYDEKGNKTDAPYLVGTYTIKAVLEDSTNYYINENSKSAVLTIQPATLDEQTIRQWVSDTTHVYGSVKGIDLSRVPDIYEVTIEYGQGDKQYTLQEIAKQGVGEYSAKVTLSDGSSQGSAVFVYSVTKLDIEVTANISVAYGNTPTKDNVVLKVSPSLPNGDRIYTQSLVMNDKYTSGLAIGHYLAKDYVQGITVSFTNDANYNATVKLDTFTVNPSGVPEIVEAKANYNSITFKFAKADYYAYKIGNAKEWTIVDGNISDTLTIEGLEADKSYTITIAYALFKDVTTRKAISTTYSPEVLKQKIEAIMQGGITADEVEEYNNILELYAKVADEDKAIVQDAYEEMIKAYETAQNPQPPTEPENKLGTGAIVAIVCACVAFVAIVAVVVVVIIKKKKNKK